MLSPIHLPPGKVPKSHFLIFSSFWQKQTWVPWCLWGGQHSSWHRELHRDSKTQIPSHHCLNSQPQASPSDSAAPKGTYIQNCNLQTPAQLQFKSNAFHCFLAKIPRSLQLCFSLWAQPQQKGSCAGLDRVVCWIHRSFHNASGKKNVFQTRRDVPSFVQTEQLSFPLRCRRNRPSRPSDSGPCISCLCRVGVDRVCLPRSI